MTKDLSKTIFDKEYDVDIHFYRRPGMKTSKHIIEYKNRLSIATAVTSFIQTLLDEKLFDVCEIEEMVRVANLGHQGKIK